MDMYEIKKMLEEAQSKLQSLRQILEIDCLQAEITTLEAKTNEAQFWTDKENSVSVLAKIKEDKSKVNEYNKVYNLYENVKIAYELVSENYENELVNELEKLSESLKEELNKLEIYSLLSSEYDNLSAIVTIHAGAGGTESQDWAEMLLRMYQKWIEKTDFIYEIYDVQEGDEAGIKSVTFGVKGMYAYGYMKCEKGVHRLVRISPFDANKRRHTSFAAVDVMPELDDRINVEINMEDIEVDTYRASGAGGQHINKTDSAVRMTHIPTGIIVSCQTERSQIQNRETCMKMLRSKLYQYELNKTQEKLKEIKGELTENSWGSQIRSYVFCPYTMVKDHRTGYEVGNVEGVMNGDIFSYIYEYLKKEKLEKRN